ncbi:hypothetical protein J3458_005011 [Metarhizium acridum]|uniref:uncharacterized protein n=1 Tax=Metarhizium acridum TaxID=92637 RepID=UPI001C6B7E1A|nr:hypothetical protein J3458_005011 [Metarhizium acridum]
MRLGKDCHTPVAMRAPEALFEPDAPLSYPWDIWSLGTAIWEILGMKFIFSESETDDEIVAQQIDVLGDRHFSRKLARAVGTGGCRGNTTYGSWSSAQACG